MIDNYDHLRTGVVSEATIVKARLFIQHMGLQPGDSVVSEDVYTGVLVEFTGGDVLFLNDGGVHLVLWADHSVTDVCWMLTKVYEGLYIVS